MFVPILLLLNTITTEETKTKSDTATTPNCPFSKLIEDVFKSNKTSDKHQQTEIQNRERVKLFLKTIANITNDNVSRKEEDLINVIIASINRIKNSIASEPDKLNEAIIINPNIKKVNQIKSGIEEKFDTTRIKKQTTKSMEHLEVSPTTEKPKYVEVLTIPSRKPNSTSANIIEVLKHLMPLFNSSLSKEVHNITIVERDPNTNHSLSASKNVSTIIVTYCDKNNNTTAHDISGNIKHKDNYEQQDKDDPDEEDYYEEDGPESDTNDDEAVNITLGEKKEIMEAAEYGMQKMHELYTVLEPKLYSMGKCSKYYFILPMNKINTFLTIVITRHFWIELKGCSQV